MRKKYIARYGGILLGALYGLFFRLFLDSNNLFDNVFGVNLFSVTFVWVVPIGMGVIPMWFANNEQLKRTWYVVLAPVLAVLSFFVFALVSGLEDFICLVVIAAPFLLSAMAAGAVAAWLITRYRKKKGILFGFAVLPFLAMMTENRLVPGTQTANVVSTVIVNAPAPVIWKNIVRVPLIDESEYRKGFFYYAGVPRPLFAELDKDTLGGRRLGHFEGGLVFNEKVNVWHPNVEMKIGITVVDSTIRNKIFDRHMLRGDHFRFLEATYHLKMIDANTTQLTLTCSYSVRTHINRYASVWGQILLSDFQNRLLEVIKKRCEILQRKK